MFGIADLSSFSSQPSSIIRPGRPDESVRTMMSRPIDCPCESGALDLPEEAVVVVDVLEVLDVHAVVLLERHERRMRLGLLVDVDVERPVRPGAATSAAPAPQRTVVVAAFFEPPHAASRPGTVSRAPPARARRSSSSRVNDWVISDPPPIGRRRTWLRARTTAGAARPARATPLPGRRPSPRPWRS